MTDILTITGLAPGNYTLVPTISINGTGTWDHLAAPGTVGIGVHQFGPSGDFNDVLSNQNFDATQASYSSILTLTGVPFNPGVAFYFDISFGTAARIRSGPANVENTQVTANFLSTLLLTGLQVRDSNGGVVNFSQLNVQSMSGATYTPTGVAPEPASILCVLGGILLLGLRKSRTN